MSSGPLAARSPGLRLALALEIERRCGAFLAGVVLSSGRSGRFSVEAGTGLPPLSPHSFLRQRHPSSGPKPGLYKCEAEIPHAADAASGGSTLVGASVFCVGGGFFNSSFLRGVFRPRGFALGVAVPVEGDAQALLKTD